MHVAKQSSALPGTNNKGRRWSAKQKAKGSFVLGKFPSPIKKLRRENEMKKLFMFLAIFALLFIFCANTALAKEKQPKVFKLGFISGLSGAMAHAAETQRKCVVLLVEQVNRRGGLNMPWGKVPVELMVKDDELKLDVGVRRFRELVEAGAHGVTGSIYNPMAGALNEECKITGTPYIPGCVPAIDSFKKGNPALATYSVAFTPWSIGWLMADALVEGMEKETIFWLGRPDSWGHTMLDGLKDGVKHFGGKIVGAEQLPKGAPDYSAVINKALAKKPDVFAVNHFGGDAIAAIKQAYDMGLHNHSLLFNCWTTYEVAMGIPPKAAAEMMALMFYYYDMAGFDKELHNRGKALREDHIKKYGFPPDAYAVLAYTAASVLLQAVEKAGSVDYKKIGKVLATETFDTVKGPARFREDHQLTGEYLAFLVKGKPASQKRDKFDVFKVLGAYGGDKALPPLERLGY
jgi:branched-chain amino acid transport system substrate-binding protein